MCAFGMGDDESIGILVFYFLNGIASEFDMDVARALPEVHLATGLLHHPLAKIGVGNKEDGAIGGGFFRQ